MIGRVLKEVCLKKVLGRTDRYQVPGTRRVAPEGNSILFPSEWLELRPCLGLHAQHSVEQPQHHTNQLINMPM